MFAVGIDISKSKSVAAILNQDGSMHTSPFEFHHTQPELDAFIKYILNSKQSATILMENTGHYHYPVLKAFQEAGLPVCMVNAYQIKKFGDMDLRKAKTDKKDAVRIARYALEKSYSLVPYTSMEQKYEDLRFLARQYNQRMLTLKTNKVFLLNLLDETMPGIQLFQSTHIFNRETGAMSQLAESSTKQWRLADTFVCGRGVPIGKFVRPYLHFKGKEQGRIDLTLTL